MKYLKLYVDFRQSMKSLSYAERGRLITGMLDYADVGSTDEISGNERFVFDAAMAEIDRQRAAYNNKVKGALKATEHRTISNDIEKIVSMKNDIVVNRNDIVQDKDIRLRHKTKDKDISSAPPDDIAQVMRAWDKACGISSPAECEIITDLLGAYGKDNMLYAIQQAVEHKAPTVAYVRAVLTKPKRKETEDKFDLEAWANGEE